MHHPAALDADVLIVGGGPVGLMTAMDLAARGATVIVLEKDPYLHRPNVKCNHVSARTMEAFRRFGLADRIRQAGMPSDHPHDIAFLTAVTGTEFGRIQLPSPDARMAGTGNGPDTAWAAAEAPHRVNQQFLEPILEEHVAGLERVSLRNGTEVVEVRQDDDAVTAVVRPVGTDGTVELRGRYLVGADGGRSMVRKAIGASLLGDPVLQQVQSTCVRVPELYARMTAGKAWCYYVYNERRCGHVFSIDGTGTFLIHTYLSEAEAAQGGVDRDQAVRDILGLSEEMAYETLSHEDWTARRLVANRFRDRRMFIAGDAAHLWVPYGGYGMNAGIADGLNLAWALGAVISGWASPAILDAYAAERQPITEQVSAFAMSHLRKIKATDIPADLEADGSIGEEARAAFGALAYQLNVQQFAAAGLNFGYSYQDSPIIIPDGTPPGYTMGSYTPSTVPGCRLPHVWREDGSSLYDWLGPWYTLIAVANPQDAFRWAEEARGAGLPVAAVHVPEALNDPAYNVPFLIARQDQHIAWRGEVLPADVMSFAAALGAAMPVASEGSGMPVAAAS